MSWLHCMWGVGASFGPSIMSYALLGGQGWPMGYRYIGILQIILTAILFISLPLWKSRNEKKSMDEENSPIDEVLTLRQIVHIPGAKQVMITFFCYCALEQTAGLWASSYLVLSRGLTKELAASFASLFFLGITIGRMISGFMTIRYTDKQMIRMGQIIIGIGILFLLIPMGKLSALIGLLLIGLGCAPIYPCIIHATPEYFGEDKSQALIGVQMASAYIGICIMPPIFGLIANYISVKLFPFYLIVSLAVMSILHELLMRKFTQKRN